MKLLVPTGSSLHACFLLTCATAYWAVSRPTSRPRPRKLAQTYEDPALKNALEELNDFEDTYVCVGDNFAENVSTIYCAARQRGQTVMGQHASATSEDKIESAYSKAEAHRRGCSTAADEVILHKSEYDDVSAQVDKVNLRNRQLLAEEEVSKMALFEIQSEVESFKQAHGYFRSTA